MKKALPLALQRFIYIQESPKHGVWVGNQYTEYMNLREDKAAKISVERITVLKEIGFEWKTACERKPLMQNSD